MTKVSKDEVARYYILCELEGILLGEAHLADDTYHLDIPKLLEALSFTYRANSVFDYVESEKYIWKKEQVSVDDIVLTGMGESLTPIIYSEQVRQNPRLFAEYIKTKLSVDDPIVEQLRPRPVPESRRLMLLSYDRDGRIKMLDGSHRLISLVMDGVDSVDAYIAVQANPKGKHMVGDAIFLRLRHEWQLADDVIYREAIEATVTGLIRSSLDGEKAVQSYWIDMAPTDEVREVGLSLVEKSSNIEA